MIAYQPERSDQRVCLYVSDGGSVWNKVERLLNGKYNTNTNTMANTNVINFHVRLPDGTEQIQFGELFRLTEGLTNKFFLKIFFFLKV